MYALRYLMVLVLPILALAASGDAAARQAAATRAVSIPTAVEVDYQQVD